MSFIKSLCRCAALVAALAVVGNASADLLVGDFQGSGVAGPVLRFAENANGNLAPISSFYTNLNGATDLMQTPMFLTYEPVEGVVYVSDFYGRAIRVYASGATGNTAALRVLNPPLLGQPRRVAIDVEHDELIAAVSGCCIAAYSKNATGNAVSPLRMVQWGGLNGSVTRLYSPANIALRKSSGEIVVADTVPNPDSSYSGLVLFFDRLANGNAAPVRAIEGPQTLLGTGVYGMAYDSGHDEIIVVARDSATARINTYAGTDSGNAAPLRSVSGNLTLLEAVNGIAYDSASGTIYVAQGGFNGFVARILAFARTANGNVAPARVVSGALSGMTAPMGLEIVPSTLIFENGFE